ncbi:HAD family hydrolase [Pseudocnuella soli]|uniref:HAD family hydrolase n=1 Tax=Pseudocnuella soli TaxID=2502779 RepID=UPI0010531F58|nr:HAD family phosphatase [Pseudocnuella soli]
MQNLPLLIFDLDGVLVDSEPLSDREFNKCLQADGFALTPEFSNKYFLGRSLRDCLHSLEDHFGRLPSEGVLEDYAQKIEVVLRNELQPIAHIPEVLPQLPHPKVVASGSEPQRIALSLEVTGLRKYFEQITSSYEVAKGKPEPDVFLKAAEKMGYDPMNCLVIEDTIFGVRAGVAAGMKVLCYQPHPDHVYEVPEGVVVFQSMAQLPDLIAAS